MGKATAFSTTFLLHSYFAQSYDLNSGRNSQEGFTLVQGISSFYLQVIGLMCLNKHFDYKYEVSEDNSH